MDSLDYLHQELGWINSQILEEWLFSVKDRFITAKFTF